MIRTFFNNVDVRKVRLRTENIHVIMAHLETWELRQEFIRLLDDRYGDRDFPSQPDLEIELIEFKIRKHESR
jgi:hypothetical protein